MWSDGITLCEYAWMLVGYRLTLCKRGAFFAFPPSASISSTEPFYPLSVDETIHHIRSMLIDRDTTINDSGRYE